MEQDTEMLESQNRSEERHIFCWERNNGVSMSINSYEKMTRKEGHSNEKTLTWALQFSPWGRM